MGIMENGNLDNIHRWGMITAEGHKSYINLGKAMHDIDLKK
jgi:hypothetical protein